MYALIFVLLHVMSLIGSITVWGLGLSLVYHYIITAVQKVLVWAVYISLHMFDFLCYMFGLGVGFRSNSVDTLLLYFMIYVTCNH